MVESGQRIRIKIARDADPRHYRVAGFPVSSDCPWPSLAAFEQPAIEENLPVSEPDLMDWPARRARLLYDEKAWLAGRWRQVRCTNADRCYRLTIEGLDPLMISRRATEVEIRRLTFHLNPDPSLLQEAVLGPALLLAFALFGTFALHASAIELDGVAFAFLGSSGVGKSTLARPPLGPGHRIADDILPVTMNRQGTIEARPRYPQLKVELLDRGAWAPRDRRPLGGVFVLDGPGSRAGDVDVSPLSALAATIAIARHTVASRLFCRILLRRQLVFASALVAGVPVLRLGYERRFASLPKVRQFVASRARALAARI